MWPEQEFPVIIVNRGEQLVITHHAGLSPLVCVSEAEPGLIQTG